MNWTLSTIAAEIFYCIIGLIFLFTGIKALRDREMKNKGSSALFWFILAVLFIVGPYLPSWLTGLGLILMSLLTAFRKVTQSKSDLPDSHEARAAADRLGYGVFIPALCLAVTAVAAAIGWKAIGANNAIGVSSLAGLLAASFLFRPHLFQAIRDGTRLMDNIGPAGILPQVLAALGALFTAAGVGDVIAEGVKHLIPDGSRLMACAVYCLSMALFTVIMGNGFAAFSVITVGVGIPFLIQNGADPVIVGTLGLTAGYCGTLLTPMAANFNIMPAALLEMKDKYAIIKSQIPVAVIMLAAHIIFMYILAF